MRSSPLLLSLVVITNALVLPSRHLQVPLLVSLDDKPRNDYMGSPQFENWVDQQTNTSFHNILQNIGGLLTILDPSNVAPGVIIASPLKSNPNYFYTWTRDSALTIRSLIHYLEDGTSALADPKKIRDAIELYIAVNHHLQRLPNRSGRFDDDGRLGLGEPKFMPDLTAFDEVWGRPQADGPGLRVLTISTYITYLNKYELNFASDFLGNATFVYNEIVRPDLEYILANWKKTSFDLWEEINSMHFFNVLTQMRALQDGINLAQSVGETNGFLQSLQEGYDALKEYILDPSSGFTHSTLPYLVETPSLEKLRNRVGLDIASLLASIHAHDIEYGNTDTIPFDIDHARVLGTLHAMVADMKYRYPVNHDKIHYSKEVGVGLGRYPEDIYDGYSTSEGNPWFISTATGAEVLYKWIYKALTRKEDLVLTSENRKFFSSILAQNKNTLGKSAIAYGSEDYTDLLVQMFNYADSFLEVIQEHVDNSGRMLEQFNKNHGFMQGADDLTWSYSAFYNSARWRGKTSVELNSYFSHRSKL